MNSYTLMKTYNNIISSIKKLFKCFYKTTLLQKIFYILTAFIILNIITTVGVKPKEGFEERTKEFIVKKGTEVYDNFYVTIYDDLVFSKLKDNFEIGQIIKNTNPTEDSYIFVSKKGDLKIIENKETLKNAVDNNEIKITAFSDAVPRLSYREENNLFDKNAIKKTSQPSLNKIDITKPNYKNLTSGTTKLQFASDTWIKSHPEYAKFFDDTKRHPLDKNYFQLKPDAKIELTPTE